MADAVAAVAGALRPVPRAAQAVLAVSGGPDSVGMAQLVTAARPDLRCVVVHIRHGLRDDAADAAAALQNAEGLGLPGHVIGVDVARTGSGPEDAARRARWSALARAATEAGAAFILTGHTADDQAETVLLNMARGTGLAGLAGMPPVLTIGDGIRVVRPVLGLRRGVVREVAVDAGLQLADDPTNDDPRQRRSRARHDLLPRLAALTGSGTDPVDSLTRLARHARRDNDALDAIAADELRRRAVRWGAVHAVTDRVLAGTHEAVATRVVRMLVCRAVPGARPSEAVVTKLLRLADGQAANLAGGIVASRGGGHLAVAAGHHRATERELTGERLVMPEIGMALRRDAGATRGVLPPWAPPRAAAMVRVDGAESLLVRPRRSGDVVRTAQGVRSVARAMSAAGVPRIARDLVPVVEDAEGVLWVPGVAIRHAAAGASALRFERWAGE
ncbi:MAG: tRNA lysidine(34) synthetase TilS [Nitriliruptorales bacterium]|nr:tRNA lysidine(34) synthetase TilS [Nitriliruptorales bacterium]